MSTNQQYVLNKDRNRDAEINDIPTLSVNHAMPWVEKYRPSCFEDIVLEPMNRTILSNILKTNYFPNLLFYGPPGTGKTTTIINLVNAYQEKLMLKLLHFLLSSLIQINFYMIINN